MRIWLACFLVLFALAELFDWIKEFNLPLPIYILGGAFLAVASNYDKLIGSYAGATPNIIRDIMPEQAQLESPENNQPVVFPTSQPIENALPQTND